MKKSLLFLLGVIFAFSTQAQITGMEVDVYEEHTGMVGGSDLTGYTTYRVYAVMQNNNDFLSAMFGLAATPLNVSTTTSFFHQSEFGGTYGQDIIPALFPTFPDVEYDSFITIGRANGDDPGINVQAAQDPSEPWLDNFNAGQNLVIDGLIGGAWFVLFGEEAVNALPDGDGRVLIGQFTTDGVLTGSINGQVFVGNDQENSQESLCVPFSSEADAIFGCTDPIAQNYDAEADVNDCSCDYTCVIAFGDIETVMTSCPDSNDGEATINVTGQFGGVDYSLDGGNFVAVNSFDGLSGGTHTITVVDTEGCEATMEFEVPAPAEIEAILTLSQGITCNGDDNAILTGTVEGGTGAYTISLSDDLADPVTEINFMDLGPGLYTVYVEDENGCAGQSTPLTITQPLAVTVNFGNTADASCFDSEDGTIVGVGFGGTGLLSYSIDGVNYQESNIFDVAAGEYTIYAQDEVGCQDESNSTIVIAAPDAITLEPMVTQPLCFGDDNGAISGAAAGGTGVFSYVINGGDAVDMLDIAAVPNGVTITVMVEDTDGCTAEFIYTMDDPAEVTVSATVTDPACNGDDNGSIVVDAAGGTGEYTYSIAGGDAQDSAEFDGLAAGDYPITVTDSNGCEASDDYSTVDPDAITIDDVTTSEESGAGAGDGSIDITANGGTGDLSYEWSGPNGYSSNDEDPNDLSGGDYTVEITDENGCTYSESFSVTTSVFEIDNGVEFTVAPNPTTGTFFLNVQGLNGQTVAYRVMDASGRVIRNNQLTGTQSEIREEIDLYGVAGGLYFLNLQVGDAVSTIRVIKQ